MYAIVKDRGHQYKVREGDRVRVEVLDAEAGASVTFDHVLLVGKDADINVGSPEVEGAKVTGTVEKHIKDKKVISTKRVRTNSLKTRRGHRTQYTIVKIEKIEN